MKFVFGTKRWLYSSSCMSITIVVFLKFYHGGTVEFVFEHLADASKIRQAVPTCAYSTSFGHAVAFTFTNHIVSYSLGKKRKKKENVRYKRIGNCVVQVLSGPTKEAFENGLCYIILGARFYLPSYEGGGGGWWGWGRCTVEGKGIRDLGTLLPQISL